MEEQRDSLSSSDREHFFEGNEFGIPRIEAYEGPHAVHSLWGNWTTPSTGRKYKRESPVGTPLPQTRRRELQDPSKVAKEEDELITAIMINKKQQQTAFQKNNPELLKKLESEYPALRAKMDSLIDGLRKEYPSTPPSSILNR